LLERADDGRGVNKGEVITPAAFVEPKALL
jgi:hypothetical protein